MRLFKLLLTASSITFTAGCSDDLIVPSSETFSIPPLLLGQTDTDAIEATTIYNLQLQKGAVDFTGESLTDTLGINGDFLGPLIRVSRGDRVKINVTNNIGETTAIHWHGLHIPAKMDGGPHQPITDGETWSPEFTIDNRAGFYWFHPHLEGFTGTHVYKGLAGIMIIDDPEESSLALPRTYGIDDFPVIIQDRRFKNSGQFSYMSDLVDHTGMRGPNILVNGKKTPPLTVPARVVRFRLLNASNARIYNIGLSDDSVFSVIASDGGLLAAAIPERRLVIAPGERYEILVDFNKLAGQSIQLLSYSSEIDLNYNGTDDLDQSNFTIMNLSVASTPDTLPETAILSLPSSLSTIVSLNESSVDNNREFLIQMKTGGVMTINNKTMKMDRIDETVYLGDTEIWTIRNMSPAPHPFHVHDVQFQILSKSHDSVASAETGWKDTVLVRARSTVRIIAKFEDFADPDIPYMYHCHILEHEDRGMMGQFIVKER